MTKILLSIFLILGSIFTSFGQIKGKALHLVGTWKYSEGSGYETWVLKGDQLIGSGYRSTKVGDSVKVEDLTISMVNKNLIYTLKTNQPTSQGDSSIIRQFIGNKSNLYFENIANEITESIMYKFGIFSKNKLRITIQFKSHQKLQKLKLRRVIN